MGKKKLSEKQKKKRRGKMPLAIKVIIVLLLFYFVNGFYHQAKEHQELRSDRDVLLQKQQELEQRIEEHRRTIESADDLESIERLARERLRMKLPGEEIYILD